MCGIDHDQVELLRLGFNEALGEGAMAEAVDGRADELSRVRAEQPDAATASTHQAWHQASPRTARQPAGTHPTSPQTDLGVYPADWDVGSRPRLNLATQAQLDEIVHLSDQWHVLVKTDNLLGPRYAVRGVLDQLQIVNDLLISVRHDARREIVRLGAKYAESASWLYEDSGNLAAAHYWNSQAMEWAHEANDRLMLAWTCFAAASTRPPT